MGLFKNTCRPVKTDPPERDLVLSLPSPTPPRKTIHNLPKTPPPQDLLITKRNPTCIREMGQDYPITRPSPGDNPTIYPSFPTLEWRGPPEDRITPIHLFFLLFLYECRCHERLTLTLSTFLSRDFKGLVWQKLSKKVTSNRALSLLFEKWRRRGVVSTQSVVRAFRSRALMTAQKHWFLGWGTWLSWKNDAFARMVHERYEVLLRTHQTPEQTPSQSAFSAFLPCPHNCIFEDSARFTIKLFFGYWLIW